MLFKVSKCPFLFLRRPFISACALYFYVVKRGWKPVLLRAQFERLMGSPYSHRVVNECPVIKTFETTLEARPPAHTQGDGSIGYLCDLQISRKDL